VEAPRIDRGLCSTIIFLGISFGFSLVRYHGITIGVASVFENTYKALWAKIVTFVSNYMP
jgi:hypothetical protein